MATRFSRQFDAAAAALPESLEAGVRNWSERLESRHCGGALALDDFDGDIEGLVRIVACSDFAGGVLLRHWDWFLQGSAHGLFASGPDSEQLARDFDSLATEAPDRGAFLKGLRCCRNRNLLRILWRDLVGGRELEKTLASLSDLADCAIRAAAGYARAALRQRFGEVGGDGDPMPLVVLAMGKLGGRELNFSSDVDLVFLYPQDGESSGNKRISAHEYFTRLARQTVALLEEVTEEGFVYRVDTRLRPFGDSGPPVVSFASLESYLLQHGRSWERYAYVKARIVTPDRDRTIADALMSDIIHPFVYRRYLDYGVFESLREMKALVAAEVKKRELADDIKLGPGGIREIEFIVQALQLVRGGSVQGLRTPSLRTALKYAVDDHDLTGAIAANLQHAYDFLRRVENCLQAMRDQQVHALPTSDAERERLAFAMRHDRWKDLESALEAQRAVVKDQFAAVAFRGIADVSRGELDPLAALWTRRASRDEWQRELQERGLEEADAMAEAIADFAAMPSTGRIDAIAARRLCDFIPRAVHMVVRHRRPSRVLRRVLDIVDRVLRRSAYLALLNENRVVLERLVELCATSGYLAKEIARFPALLDELIDARRYVRAPGTAEMRADLERRIGLADPADTERQVEMLAEFKRAMLFRLAVADFSGSIPIMKVSDRLTDLAEMILSRALELAHVDLVARFGQPRYEIAGRQHTAGLGIIAYGKLGGMELSYGSDLDLVFLHDSRGARQETDGARTIDNSVFFSRLARRLVHFLTIQTGSGALYEIDMRLRPSGRSGLLVTSIDAFERYQEENAWTWEHQALLRGRAVAGSSIVAREFERIRAQTLTGRVRRDTLASDVVSMRRKMRKELDKSDAERFDLKQGQGGIADIEFLVQYLVLANADAHPAVVHYSDNIRQLGTLAAAGVLSEADTRRLQEIYKRYRSLTHRLALDDRAAFAPAEAFGDERAFVAAGWQSTFGDGAD